MSVDHYENFPVASWLCPASLRPPIRAIYWFARTADDLADEGQASAVERQASLLAYRRDLAAVYEGRPTSSRWAAVWGPLRQAIHDHELPRQALDDLLDAFLQDCDNPLHPNRDSLLDYCRRSANPVGRLLLHLYGIRDATALRQSDAVCSALQLINFWQDLSVDLPRGRCYLPLNELHRHGLTAPALLADPKTARPELPALLSELCQWAGSLMHQGQGLVHRLPGRAGWELRLVVQGGLRILEKIAAMDHDTLARRPRLHAADAPLLAWRTLTHPAQ